MNQKPIQRPLRRALADAALGLVMFMAFAFGLAGARWSEANPANATELARVAAFTGPMEAKSAVVTVAAKPTILLSTGTSADGGQTQAMVLLAFVFSVLFAFNLAFFRHLRRVYAMPRTRLPRKGR